MTDALGAKAWRKEQEKDLQGQLVILEVGRPMPKPCNLGTTTDSNQHTLSKTQAEKLKEGLKKFEKLKQQYERIAKEHQTSQKDLQGLQEQLANVRQSRDNSHISLKTYFEDMLQLIIE